MRRLELNPAALALPQCVEPRDPLDIYRGIVERTLKSKVGRRDFFKLTAGAATALPVFGALARAANSFEFRNADGVASFVLDGSPLWTIDPSLFDGAPELSVRERSDSIALRLRNAMYPGTGLSADLMFAASRTATGWSARLQLEKVGFDATFDLAAWLIGQPVGNSAIAASMLHESPEAAIALQGTRMASFFPDWTLRAQSSGVATVRSRFGSSVADSVQVELISDPLRVGILHGHTAPRTRISLASGEGFQGLGGRIGDAAIRLDASPRLIVAEATTARNSGTRALGFLISTKDDRGAASFCVDAPSRMDLRTTRMAEARTATIAFLCEGADRLALARLEPICSRFWVQCGDMFAEVAGKNSRSCITIEEKGNRSSAAATEMRVERFIVPFAGVDQAVFVRRGGWTNALGRKSATFDGTLRGVDDLSWCHSLSPFGRSLAVDEFELHLTRGSEALHAVFRFHEIKLVGRAGSWCFECDGTQPMIELDLGHQHVQEGALFPLSGSGSVALSDDEIHKLTGKSLAEIRKAREECRFNAIYQQALAEYRRTHPEESNAAFSSRYAGRSWLTFDLVKGDGGSGVIPLELQRLFAGWGEATYKGRARDGWLRLRTPERAKAANFSLREQIALFGKKPFERPQSVGEFRRGQPPTGAATSIEAPYRLVVSPAGTSKWMTTALIPRRHGELRPVWHAKVEAQDFRAVWSPDLYPTMFEGPDPSDKDFGTYTSVGPRDRHELVALTSWYGQAALLGSELVLPIPPGLESKVSGYDSKYKAECGVFNPKPVKARIFAISSLGATIKVEGSWEPPSAPPCDSGALRAQRYNHDLQVARDRKVVVEYKCTLFPVGHPVTLVKETERKLVARKGQPEDYDARLVQRLYLKWPSFNRDFPAFMQPFASRAWPFQRISMEADVSPDIYDPLTTPESQINCGVDCATADNFGIQAFWPVVVGNNGRQYLSFRYFDPVLKVALTSPLIVVDNDIVHHRGRLRLLIGAYRRLVQQALGDSTACATPMPPILSQPDPGTPQRCIARVVEGDVQFAPPRKPADTVFPTSRFVLDVDIPRPLAENEQTTTLQCSPTQDDARFAAQAKGLPIEEAPDDASQLRVILSLRMSAAMESAKQPPFYPHLRQASITPRAIKTLTGIDQPGALVEIDSPYLRFGFDPARNAGEIFLRYVSKGVDASFAQNTSQSGGFVNPGFVPAGRSRLRGDVGGAEMKSQLRGLRYPEGTGVVISSRGAPSSADPGLDAARSGAFDPMEYFSQSLADAKLLGLVRLVDILHVAPNAGSLDMPEAIEEFEHALTEAALLVALPTVRAAIGSLRSVVQQIPSSSRARAVLDQGTSQLGAAVQELETVARSGSATRIAAAATAMAQAVTRLGRGVQAIVDDPKSILPADALDSLEDAQHILKKLNELPDAIAALGRDLSDWLAGQVRENLRKLQMQIASDPRLADLRASVDSVLAGIDALDQSMRVDARGGLVEMARRLGPIFDALEEIGAWSARLEILRTDLCGRVTDWITTAASSARSVASASLRQANELSAQITSTQRTFEESGVANAHASVRDLFADAARGAHDLIAMADAATRSTAALPEIDWNRACGPALDAATRRQVDKANAVIADAFACSFAAIDLAKPLRDRLARVANAPSLAHVGNVSLAAVDSRIADAADRLQGLLKTAIRSYADDPTLRSVLSKAKAAFATVPAEPAAAKKEAAAIVWRLQSIEDSLNRIKSPTATLDDMAAEVGLGRQYDALRNILALSTNVEQSLMAAATDIRASVQSELERRLCGVHWRLASWIREAGLQKESIDEATRSYLAPDLVRGITDVATAADDLVKRAPPNEAECPDPVGSRASLARFLLTADRLLDDLRAALGTGDVTALVNAQAIIESARKALGLPTKFKLSYRWKTSVKAYPKGGDAIFVPRGDGTLSIDSVLEADLTGQSASRMSIEGRLDPFEVRLFGAASFLRVLFKPLSFSAGTGRSPDFYVAIDKVTFGQQLDFVQRLQESLLGNSGFYVSPREDGPGVEIGYRYRRELIQLAPFALQNVALSIACVLPFNNEATRFKFQLAEPQNPCLLIATPMGGGMYAGVSATASGIEFVDASFEYGVVTAFEFGPATGSGRITAGVYIRLAAREALVAGFFNASGAADIAGLISVSALFRVQIAYSSATGEVKGDATFTIEFSIALVDYGFDVPVSYSRQGDTGGSSKSGTDAQRQALTDERNLAANFTKTVSAAAATTAASELTRSRRPLPRHSDMGSTALLDEDLWRFYWNSFEEVEHECH